MAHTPSPQELICRWLMHGAYDDRYFTALYEALAGKNTSLSSKGRGGPLLAYIMKKISSPNKREDAESVLTITFTKFFKAIQQRNPTHEQIKALVLLPNPSLGGEFRQKQAERWTGKIGSWVNEAMGFCQTHYGYACAENLQEQANAVNQQLNPLRYEAVNMMAWLDAIINSTETDEENLAIANPEDEDDETETTDAVINAAVTVLLKKIAQLMPEQDGAFANDLGAILRMSPKLKIPTAALLYTIAKNEMYSYGRDEAKHNAKRDQTKKQTETETENTDTTPKSEDEEVQLRQDWVDIVELPEQATNITHLDPTAEYAPDSIDDLPDNTDAEEREQWEFLQHTYALLRIPLAEAEKEADRAYGGKNEQRAEDKLSKQRIRFNENMAILKLTMASHTEEEIGKKLCLTRDQIRYRKRDIQSLLASLKNTD